MKQLMRHVNDGSVLKVENAALRRENAALRDELAAARAEIRRQEAYIEDLVDMTGVCTLAPELERLHARRAWAWKHHPRPEDRALSVDQAHAVMREHLSCLTGSCRARRAAVRVLRESGRLVPDSGRPALLELD